MPEVAEVREVREVEEVQEVYEAKEVPTPGPRLRGVPEMRRSFVSTTTDIGSFIARTDDVRGGRARIAGTGVTVRRVAGWYKLGLMPDEIADRLEHLSLAQVHAALAYYHANREEIDTDIAREEDESERLDREHYLSRDAR